MYHLELLEDEFLNEIVDEKLEFIAEETDLRNLQDIQSFMNYIFELDDFEVVGEGKKFMRKNYKRMISLYKKKRRISRDNTLKNLDFNNLIGRYFKVKQEEVFLAKVIGITDKMFKLKYYNMEESEENGLLQIEIINGIPLYLCDGLMNKYKFLCECEREEVLPEIFATYRCHV